MCNFHVGQKVVCVDDSGLARWPIKKGQIYTVAAVGLYSRLKVLIDVAEVKTERPFAWEPERFRPVKSTSIDVFTAMLAPTPCVKERA